MNETSGVIIQAYEETNDSLLNIQFILHPVNQ